MIECNGWKLPDGETHLQQFLTKPETMVDGRGTYQRKKYLRALGFCKHKRTAVDIGAHVGLWSWQMARDFKDVQAFEPVESHRICFAVNVPFVPQVRLYPFALTSPDKDGFVKMKTDPASSGDTYPDPENDTYDVTDVKTACLDDFYEIADVDLIKIDCEGYEMFVIAGGIYMIEAWRPVIVVEQKPGKAQKYGLRERQAVEYLSDQGYSVGAEMSGDFIMVPDG